MKYKESMFNFKTETGDGMYLLYNSLRGFQSLTIIPASDYDHIISCITDNITDNADIYTEQFEKLKKKGIIVGADTDEKALRSVKCSETINENILRLIIMPTEKCNFRCSYCYESFEKGAMNESTANSLVNYVRRNIYKYSALDVRWFGGEPLEAYDTVLKLSDEFLNICKTSKRYYSSSMITNGYNLSADRFRELYKRRVTSYQITVDGLRETHDRARCLQNGHGTFEKITDNIRNIRKQCGSPVLRVTIRNNLTRDSARDIIGYLDFFRELLGDDKRFSFSFQKASDWGGDRVGGMREHLLNNDEYSEVLDCLIREKHHVNVLPHIALMSAENCVCYAGKRNSFVIGSDGTVYKCTGDFSFAENRIGFLNESGMIIDENRHAKWLCSQNRANPRCDACFFSGACLMSSCPSAFLKNINHDEICLFEKKYAEKYMKLLDESYYERV